MFEHKICIRTAAGWWVGMSVWNVDAERRSVGHITPKMNRMMASHSSLLVPKLRSLESQFRNTILDPRGNDQQWTFGENEVSRPEVVRRE
jgi:hypothetical protein